jgi:type II restriction enzyme
MESILTKAIQSAQESEIAFTKFIMPNDTGSTGGHQAGFHIHKNSWQLFTDKPGNKGSNESKFIQIRWQDEFETTSRFIYYGVSTRNEYRLTRFGRGFPFLTDDNVGDLLIICKKGEDYYDAFVLQSDEDIDNFFAALNISSADTNGIIPKQSLQTPESKLMKCFISFLKSFSIDFPATIALANSARNCYNIAYGISNDIIKQNPDKEILNWLKSEFELFKVIENDRYDHRIRSPFSSVEELIILANTILNRRKSRAGKSLEHHLSEIFNTFGITYAAQVVTEDYKKPDFIFPNAEAYYNHRFNPDNLIMLASKTTCKDRWRQILNEADRIKTKHLFTLQQGISINQLEEMYKNDVCLVVPKPYLESFPKMFRSRILTLNGFVNHVITKQSLESFHSQ